MSDPRVRVEVVRSGGFAGISRTALADTAQLDQQQSAELRQLLDESAEDRTQRAPASGPPQGADRFQYDVTIQEDDHTESFVRQESELTPAEQRLVRWVLSSTRS